MSKPLDPNSKSGFIRQHMDKPTSEIIALAASNGLKLSSGLVGMVRRAAGGAPVKPKKNGVKVRASALRKKAPKAKAKRKYTRRLPKVEASNGKIPGSVSAIVQKFVADLQEATKQTMRDAVENSL